MLSNSDAMQQSHLLNYVIFQTYVKAIMEHTESLRKNEDFRTCYKNGKSYANRYLVVYVLPNGTDRNRIGISVSKKVGNSVVRHRIKRLVRESYRLHERQFDSGSDIAVIGRRSADGASYHEIESALLFLLGRAGIYHLEKAKEETS